MTQKKVSLKVDEVTPWSPFDSPPSHRSIPFHRWPKKPDPSKKYRIALLAGDGVDEETLGGIAESMYGNLTGDFCVIFFPRGIYLGYTEGLSAEEEKVLKSKFKTSFPLPRIAAEEAVEYTVLDIVFRKDNKFYHFERPAQLPTVS